MAISGDQSYEKKVINEENKQLIYFTERSQTERNAEVSNKLFLNLSIKEILQNMSLVFVSIINELVSGQAHNMSDYIMIFFKESRMIYVGLVVLFVAFSIYIVDVTQ